MNIEGLSSQEAKERQLKYGKNELVHEKKENFFLKMIHIMSEPMFTLLLAASIIYFILGEPKDGFIMLIFVVGMIGIDVIQEWKTDKTLQALKTLSEPKAKVMRDGKISYIDSVDIVPGDLLLVYEGVKIPADGFVIKCSGLSVDESTLTGETVPVMKTIKKDVQEVESDYWKKDYCYAGTSVVQGTATLLVDQIGNHTEYGKIGMHVINVTKEESALKKQMDHLVKVCAWISLGLCVMVAILTFFNIPDHEIKARIIESILSGITLAMAMIPEEFPVILTVFLSMGAWRLAKKNSLVKKLTSVETLGEISVLCVDKTGTITQNKMAVVDTWSMTRSDEELCETMGLCCEEDTYDPMEKAMIRYCETIAISKSHLFGGKKIKDYPFTNETKMMGRVWIHDDELILAAKGSPESLMPLCHLSNSEKKKVNDELMIMSRKGLRVIAVAKKRFQKKSSIPDKLSDNDLHLCGLIGLQDPPRDNINEDIKTCYEAGVRVVMITGDNGVTASSIAKQIGMKNADEVITGEMIDQMSDDELQKKIKNVSIFSRVIPEHKMRIVKAFQASGDIVAMTGDGVNDAPALKASNIGIAMGKRGSEVSRESADLILMDDNFKTIVETIKDGRRIYDNIKKAVQYIFVIHIPIAMASLLSPMFHIEPDALLFLPIQIVLMEIMIDPTCSIVLERQPNADNIMKRGPRNPKESLMGMTGLLKSIIQGLVIFGFAFATYYFCLQNKFVMVEEARSMGIVMIILANFFLVMENSSDEESVLQSIRKLAQDKMMWLVTLIVICYIAVIIYSPLNSYLQLYSLSIYEMIIVIILAMISVFWYEAVKDFKRIS